MSDKEPALVILSPGFPADEKDSTCIPPQQIFVKALKRKYSSLKIIVLAFQYPFESKRYKWNGVNVISFNGRNRGKLNRIQTWRQVWRTMKQIKKDNQVIGILSFWLGECALIGKHFAKRNHIKQYTWILGQDARKGNKYFHFIKPHAGELIALSDFIAEEFVRNYRVKPEHIIPVGVDTFMFKTENKSRDIDIMAAGSIIPLKRYDLFTEIIKALSNNLPDVKAVICGGGSEKEKLQSHINGMDLKKHITLAGEVSHPEVIGIMQRSKVFLHTSSYEGLGAVCLEALYAGCHVVSFCQPMSEDIRHWHIVNSKEEMVLKAHEILANETVQYSPVLFYPVEDTAASVMNLFSH